MASVDRLVVETLELFRPTPRRDLSDWAEAEFVLSAESAAEPGPWKTIPYQRGIMNALTNPDVRQVTLMKSARVGATKIMNALIGYHVDQDPCPVMLIQPTVEDAKGYSKEEIAPMLRDVPRLARLFPTSKVKDSSNTLLHKQFPGGSISMVGANSGRGFRRVSRRVVIADEADGYPLSAGTEGDPIKLAMKRSEYYWNRLTFIASTPGIAGRSRIAEFYDFGDQRRYYVPCPHCGHKDFLVFREQADGAGHFMAWEKGKPKTAHFVCSKNGCVIEHKDKRRMVAGGEWIAAQPFTGHASFHIWAAYSFSPNASWEQIVTEWLEAQAGGPEPLKVFINTVLGETWKDRGDAPEWRRLYQRREQYLIGTVPDGVICLTAGVDVQRDRLVWEVVGWGENRQSWSIDAGVIPGDTSAEPVWVELDKLLAFVWFGSEAVGYGIRRLAIDSGYNTQQVYTWAMKHPLDRVIAVKGQASASVLLGAPSPVFLKTSGKKLKRGGKVWPVGVNIAKTEFYGWLRQELPAAIGDSLPVAPPGYCHFPEYGEDFFQQITAEHLVPHKTRKGFTALEWELIPGRENHYLDCRVYARAAVASIGLDRLAARVARQAAPVLPPSVAPGHQAPPALPPGSASSKDSSSPRPQPTARPPPKQPKSAGSKSRDGWLGGGRGGRDSYWNRQR